MLRKQRCITLSALRPFPPIPLKPCANTHFQILTFSPSQVDELSGADVPANGHPAAAASRLRYGLSVWFPSWPALQKELGEEMVRNGMVGAALDVFERLELWDNLIYCLK